MSSVMRRQIENAATGTSGSMVKINGALIKHFFFCKPPLKEQHHILGILQAQDSRLAAAESNRKKLFLIKTALMQDLLTGKVRVTPLLTKQRKAVTV